MNAKAFHLVVVGGALITAVLTALANVLIARTTTLDVFTFSLWVVIPAGALLIVLSPLILLIDKILPAERFAWSRPAIQGVRQ